MRALRSLHVSTLCILVAGSAALYAQDGRRQPEQPQRQEEPRPEMNQGQEQQRPEEARPANQDKQEQKAEKQEQKQQQKEQKDQERQSREQMKDDHQMNNDRPVNGDRQMNNAQQGHARPAGKSAHIPEERFRANFGRSHTFVVQRPVVIEGQTGFVYGGYSFVFVDPWPSDWAYTDDCYVDYIDGEYFLFDVLHPGIRIALFVVVV